MEIAYRNITACLIGFAFILFLGACDSDDEEVIENIDLSNCDVVPSLENLKIWEVNYPEYLDDTITLGALAVYNEKLHLVDNNRLVPHIYVFNFENEMWELSIDSSLFYALQTTYQDANIVPWGLKGIEIVGDTLLTVGIAKASLSAINLKTQEFIYNSIVDFPRRRCISSAVAYSYPYGYIACHSAFRTTELEETQRLYGIDIRTNDLIIDVPLHLSEKISDGAHGLTTFKNDVWHARDEKLVQMNGETGEIVNVYDLNHGLRSSSICYFNKSLWISNYYGGLLEVPLICG